MRPKNAFLVLSLFVLSCTPEPSRCGDGIVQAPEACDDGNLSNNDDCTNSCTLPTCGDGFVQGNEACDDNNQIDQDFCKSDCTLSVCGDGITHFVLGESCDDGNTTAGDGCDAQCQEESPAPFCGDGVVQAGELCDDGNQIDQDFCTRACAPSVCGDGIIHFVLGEACDDGNISSGDGCNSTCQREVASTFCGDGTVQAGEACDDGNNSDFDACTSFCQIARCGDGLTQANVEACDDGNLSNNDGCTNSCTLPTCGDGFVQSGEACDDGNAINQDFCKTDCQASTCGDGIIHFVLDESCEDGNNTNGDGCTAQCQREEPATFCGDGAVQAGEACDDGNQINTDSCTSFCQLPRCGDGFAQSGEQCDDGNLSNTDACTNSCQNAVCGDGFTRAGIEQCDDGNNINNDFCRVGCFLPSCGDGVIQFVLGESCDDSNNTNGDGCSSACHIESCGDGFVQAPEQCDDGNDINTDACTNACTLPTCGDGFIQAGEECDDQNSVDNDFCRNSCLIPDCGDGIVQAFLNESCDDNDTQSNDGCDADCAPSSVAFLDSGNQHACVVTRVGDVRCWGDPIAGKLGYANQIRIGDNETPATAGSVNVGALVAQVTAGGANTCALLTNGNVRCWGDGFFGAPGYGNTNSIGDNEAPAAAGNVNVGGAVAQITAGNFHICALLTDGNVRCWGDGSLGKLGYGNTNNIGDNETPAAAGNVNVGGTVTQLAAGTDHTCALLTTGAVRCWGGNANGQLGYGNTNNIGDNETPASAGNVNVGGTVIQIAAGGAHTCALLDTGNVRCWGQGSFGMLGYANQTTIGDNEAPAVAGNVNVGGLVSQIAVGGLHTCALLTTGSVRCWGLAGSGQLGYGNTTDIGDTEAPATAGDINVGGDVVQISLGGEFSCALLSAGSVRCWGNGSLGNLGYGNTNNIGDNETPAAAGNLILF